MNAHRGGSTGIGDVMDHAWRNPNRLPGGDHRTDLLASRADPDLDQRTGNNGVRRRRITMVV